MGRANVLGPARIWLLVLAPLGTLSAQACGDDETNAPGGGGQAAAFYDAADVVVQAPAAAAPGQTIDVTITARNSGTETWRLGEVDFQFTGDPAWQGADLALGAETAPGATGTFTATGVTVVPPEGSQSLSWRASQGPTLFGPPALHNLIVACDDGTFCNGVERLTVGGLCVSSGPPCDDGEDCTADVCEEDGQLCSHTLGANCAQCSTTCVPDCAGKVCGDDGCGLSCGTCTGIGEACASVTGQCVADDSPGTCGAPFDLVPLPTPLDGLFIVTDDSSDGTSQVVPTCNNTSTAVEHVYSFVVTATVGMDARPSGYDTVLHLRKEDPLTLTSECSDDTPAATVGCSDDASPPGDYGSRIAMQLDPGTYYLIVDGFDYTQFGPYELSVKFNPGGCVPQCDGLYCGGDDTCGSDCGTCDAGFTCNAMFRCEETNCTADCAGKECGDDGCGGSCGDCTAPDLCVPATGTCEAFAACDPDAPTCSGCAADEFCGVDCACHAADGALPDLVVNEARLASEILFETADFSPESCAVVEGCVDAGGARNLMRFSVEAINQGQATLEVPAPDTRPDLFEWSLCHGHYHFRGFAEYELLDAANQVLLTGRKQAYCMEDTAQYHPGPGVICEKVHDCEFQGIEAGWSDLYGNSLDCQWLDVTDVPPGEYSIRVRLNPGHNFQEQSFDNNEAVVPVTIP